MDTGYGYFREDGRNIYAHRFVCERAHGVAPTSSHQATHRCGLRACVNKKHLRWATRLQNKHDELEHGTRACGSKHGMAKLTIKEVIAIRSSRKTQILLSEQFGISRAQVGRIKNGKRWSRF
jgi:hypothetical protein